MSTTVKLRFYLREVMELAEHAIAAPEHCPDYAQYLDHITPGAALHWVTDAGTYLMSNGLPGQPKPLGGEGSQVCYAAGWDENSDRYALGQTAVGHDDDLTALELGDPTNPKSLIGALRRARVAGGRWLVLTVSDDDLKLEVRA